MTLHILRGLLPNSIRRKIRAMLMANLQRTSEPELTVAQGWEQYAKKYNAENGRYLGDEWNEPEVIGVDVPADQILAYLDEQVFAPFLGNPDVILEIGSGGGRFTEILLPKCTKLIATDTSRAMLKHLRQRLGDNSKVEYLLLDGFGLQSVSDESVDAAFSYGVFVHLQPWDIFNYLTELYRILRPGGRAIIQHANTFSQLGWARFISDLQPSLNRHKLPWSFTVMTPQIMQEFAQRAGLALEECLTEVVRRDCISLIKKLDFSL